MGHVVGGCNVQCTCCTEHSRYGLSCLHAETVESMSSASWVCMVCMVHVFDMLEFKLCCEIFLLLNMVDMDQ